MSSPLLRGCDEVAAAAAVVLKGECQEPEASEEEEEEEDEAPQHAELSSHDISSSHGLGTTGTIAALSEVGAAAPATPRRPDLNSERDALEERLERVRCEVAALRRELLGAPARREDAAAAAAARDSLWECAMAQAEARQ